MLEANKEIAIKITELVNKILSTENHRQIFAFFNELYSVVDNSEHISNNDFRRVTLLRLLKRDIESFRSNEISFDIKSTHNTIIDRYQALLGIYLEDDDRVKFLREIEHR